MNTQENNKLIAEFMGCVENPNNGVWNTECPFEGKGHHLETMKYHKSWDWLMPVVKKIKEVNGYYPKELNNVSLFSEKREVFKAVAEFIKQYNKNK